MTRPRRRRCGWTSTPCTAWATYLVAGPDLPLCTAHARTYWANICRAALYSRPRRIGSTIPPTHAPGEPAP